MFKRITRRAALGSLAVTSAIARVAVGKSNDSNDPVDEFAADHVLVNVSDFQQSVAWYRDKLGFEEVVRWTVDGLADTNLAYLRRGSFMIEIACAPKTEKTTQLPPATDFASHFAQRGITHLCFRVADVDTTLEKLNQQGVDTFSEPIDFQPLRVRVGFIQDPDGNVIEFKGPMKGNNVVQGSATWRKSAEPK